MTYNSCSTVIGNDLMRRPVAVDGGSDPALPSSSRSTADMIWPDVQ
jgi:hypothetical protein